MESSGFTPSWMDCLASLAATFGAPSMTLLRIAPKSSLIVLPECAGILGNWRKRVCDAQPHIASKSQPIVMFVIPRNDMATAQSLLNGGCSRYRFTRQHAFYAGKKPSGGRGHGLHN